MMISLEDVHGAASGALMVLQRVAADGGVVSQIADGQWDADLDTHIARIDVVEVLEGMREAERRGRACLGSVAGGFSDHESPSGPTWDDSVLDYAGDAPRTRRYRRAQSRWRETVLHLPPGHSDGGRLVGSMLRADAPVDAQWLTPQAAAYANARLNGGSPGNAPMNDRRLTRNLLSSMPLCFNIFGQLDAHRDAAARVLANTLRLDIARVGPIQVEHAPLAAHAALHDRTAFDAYVPYTTSTGDAGFLAVETKYTEPFSPTPHDHAQYFTITDDPDGWFQPQAGADLVASATNQLWRNAMLAQLTELKDHAGTGTVVVLALEDDQHADDACEGVAAALREPGRRLLRASMEGLADAALREPDLVYWAHLMSARYLSPV